MGKLVRILILGMAMMVFAGPVWAEGITKEQGDAILKELKQIRKELGEIKKQNLRAPRRGPAPAAYGQSRKQEQSITGRPQGPDHPGGVYRLPVPFLP